MVKCLFLILLIGLYELLNSVFKLVQLPLLCSNYSCINKQVKTINMTFKVKSKGTIQHSAIDSTGLKVYGEDE
ncbi:Mobile element protein [Candidatus Enterovibrio altilux]|uniref:Mobile element protein n=1 Tax=Candidatus Enterovibrio altilux TaxID=1927128 RepID=A0A291B8Z2_9GAMM|nr:Mobile element protein [Candidatus Enterovibrio luxaltus]